MAIGHDLYNMVMYHDQWSQVMSYDGAPWYYTIMHRDIGALPQYMITRLFPTVYYHLVMFPGRMLLVRKLRRHMRQMRILAFQVGVRKCRHGGGDCFRGGTGCCVLLISARDFWKHHHSIIDAEEKKNPRSIICSAGFPKSWDVHGNLAGRIDPKQLRRESHGNSWTSNFRLKSMLIRGLSPFPSIWSPDVPPSPSICSPCHPLVDGH